MAISRRLRISFYCSLEIQKKANRASLSSQSLIFSEIHFQMLMAVHSSQLCLIKWLIKRPKDMADEPHLSLLAMHQQWPSSPIFLSLKQYIHQHRTDNVLWLLSRRLSHRERAYSRHYQQPTRSRWLKVRLLRAAPRAQVLLTMR
jgi:hypothetical protein